MPRFLLLAISLLLLSGCIADEFWVVPPPSPPPQPVPPGPDPLPTPPNTTRAAMEAVQVGGPADGLSALPDPYRKTTFSDGTEVWVWVIDEPRPDGGNVMWEVYVKDGKVSASHDI